MAQQTAPKSEMQKDMDAWVGHINKVAKDSSHVTVPAGEADWTNGFFECFNPIDTCLVTYCCPCVTFGKTYHRLHKDPQLRDYSPVNASCLGWWASACCGLWIIGSVLQRNEIAHRSQPKLRTNLVTDVLKGWCCHCCDLIQQDKEAAALVAREQQTIAQQPSQQAGMSYEAKH